jgi:hypothetical protein
MERLGGNLGGQEAVIEDPPHVLAGINEVLLQALQDSLVVGWISSAEIITAIAAIARQPTRVAMEGNNLS